MPFLVDSIAAAIAEAGLVIDLLAHPVLSVERDAKGTLAAIPDTLTAGSHRESMIYIETPRIDARQRRELLRSIESTLAAVRYAVTDWLRMLHALRADADTVTC